MGACVNDSVLVAVLRFATVDFGTVTVIGCISAPIRLALTGAFSPLQLQLGNVRLLWNRRSFPVNPANQAERVWVAVCGVPAAVTILVRVLLSVCAAISISPSASIVAERLVRVPT